MIDLNKLKSNLKEESDMRLLPLEYEELEKNVKYIMGSLGNKGMVMFTEDVAMIYFDKTPKLRLKVKHKRYFIRKDFEFLGKNFDIIGQGPDEVQNPIKMFFIDLKNNIWKSIIILSLFIVAVNPLSYNIDALRIINEKLIDVIGIFIGMVFVFIGFFYGDKERTVEVYKKGLCYAEFKTDCYVIKLAVVEMVILCFSLLFSSLSFSNVPYIIKNVELFQEILNFKLKYGICFSLNCIAVVILVIEFDALINYYLKTMRNKYFKDAFESKIDDRK